MSRSLVARFFSKHLLIHRIVINSAFERLGEDWYHNIIRIKCFRVAKSGAFKYFLRISIFSKSIACLGLIAGNKHRPKIPDIKWDFSGGQKNRGSSRLEGQSPQLEMIPYFFFKLIFLLNVKDFGRSIFFKKPPHPQDSYQFCLWTAWERLVSLYNKN